MSNSSRREQQNNSPIAAFLAQKLRGESSESIAVVGLGCRFPGSDGAEEYWKLLREGAAGIREVPRSRWNIDAYYAPEPATPGKMCTRCGGFIDGIDLFDAGLFGIAPREAECMDPQQRLLLETSWESLESAGIDPRSLGGSRTCVFVGIGSWDYSKLFGLEEADAYMATGVAHSAAVGRISYVLDLWGANEAVDTACSSSLVAVHRACTALRHGEADLALAGGVNVLLDPELMVGLSQARMLSRDGQCKTFDARADGYVRSEGCGLVVLKRLSDAQRDRDRVLSVILGSAENHDGRSQGLTAPNGLSQQAVIRGAQAVAGLGPSDISYIEAHGSGTPLGDPQELAALGAVWEGGRERGRRVPVGSAKTNVGHLEAAAGAAGLIKTVLLLMHHEIPMHRNVQSVNPYIAIEELPLVVPTEARPWREGGRRRACVSSFGFSGTNAHVVLEEAPEENLTPGPTRERSWHALTMSARTPEGLRALAGRYAQHIAEYPSERIGDICFTANVGRTALMHRAALVFESSEKGRDALRRWSRGEKVEGIETGAVDTSCSRPRVGFVFPAGTGALRAGRGRALYDGFAAFRRAMEECEKESNRCGVSILPYLYPTTGQEERLDGSMEEIGWFALGYSVSELWRSLGVQPEAVGGAGVGKYVAGVVTGMLGLSEVLRLLAARARGQQELREQAGSLQIKPGRVTLVSAPGEPSPTDAAYWDEEGSPASASPQEWERRLGAQGCDLVVGTGDEGAHGTGERGLEWLWSLGVGEPDDKRLLRSASRLFVLGMRLDWRKGDEGFIRQKVGLPTYEFDRQRYWLPTTRNRRSRVESLDRPHPLLGRKMESALGGIEFEVDLDGSAAECLKAHRVQGAPVMPGMGYLELALASAREAGGAEECSVEQLSFERALPLDGTRRVQLALVQEAPGRARVEIHSRGDNESSWTLHSRGIVEHGKAEVRTDGAERLSGVRERVGAAVDIGQFYAAAAEAGFEYGEQFQTVRELWRTGSEEALGRVRLDGAVDDSGYNLHPALLDGCLHVTAAVQGWQTDGIYLPASIDKVTVLGRVGREGWSHARERRDGGSGATRVLDVRVWNAEGELRVDLEGLQLHRVERSALQAGGAEKVGWLYEMIWEATAEGAVAERSAGWLPTAAELAEIEGSAGEELSRELQAAQAAAQMDPELDGLCAGFVSRALGVLGLGSQTGKPYETQELAERLGIAPRHRRLFPRLAKMLADTGVLASAGRGWEVRGWRQGEDLQAQTESLQRRYPQNAPALQLASRCGENLASILRGAADPLTALFGDEGTLTGLYRESPSARYCNKVIREAVAKAAKRVGAGRKLRVLEIGAGTGGTSAYVLPALAASQTEYVFSDVSPVFLSKAAESFHDYGWIEYKLLDIEEDPVAQGFIAKSFDVIIAANVLHATKDLAETLTHVQKLLAHRGLLLLFEAARATPFLDLTFGLTDGWWRCADEELRSGYPLLDEQRWSELLKRHGFDEVVSLPPGGSEALGQTVILARGGTEPSVEAIASQRQAALSEAVRGRWLLFADQGGAAQRLATQMSSLGAECELVYAASQSAAGEGQAGTRRFVDPAQPEDLVRLIAEVSRGSDEGLRGVVHLWSLDARRMDALTPQELEAELSTTCGSVLHLVQALVKSTLPESPQLVLVTSGVQHAGGVNDGWTSESALPASLWGMGRTIANEHPELRCKRVDWAAGDGAQSLASLVEELGRADAEDEVALRAGRRYVARLKRAEPLASRTDRRERPVGESFELVPTRRGVLDSLTLCAREREHPGAGELEIEVVAAGLNFRDVMNAMGVDPSGNNPLGGECAGRVVTVGSGVRDFRVGDEVIVGLALNTFRRFCIADARFVVHKPRGISFEEAVTIPVTFLTAHYAFHSLTNLSRGQRVLIHAGAGGVGLAAIQLAQRIGAEIYATAGSARKRAYLRSLGVKHVMSSRTLDFVDELAALTGGQGVDVVLNSLAGDFVYRGLSVLKKGGHFVEIGKTLVLRPEEVPPDIQYSFFDLGTVCFAQDGLWRRMWQDAEDALAHGVLKPLPFKVFPVEEAVSAFRYMAQGKHIGKIVLGFQQERQPTALEVREDGTYLITGGLGGLGVEIARMFVQRGAGRVLLMSRRAPDAMTREKITSFDPNGAHVEVVPGDVSLRDDVARVISDVSDALPLRGIVHAAGVLDDSTVAQLDWARFLKVLRPKVLGATYLHELSSRHPLDFFVTFSSFTAILGSRGQVNHVSANAFLDGFAFYRRRRGLPALSINWGAWLETGYAAREADFAALQAMGVMPITTQDGLVAFDKAAELDGPQVGCCPMEWGRFAATMKERLPARFTKTATGVRDHVKPQQPAKGGLRMLVEAADEENRKRRLSTYLRDQIGQVLGASVAETLAPQQALKDLGLDSLMAIELRNRLGKELGTALPATLLFDYPTLEALSGYLLSQVLKLEAKKPERTIAAVTVREDNRIAVVGMGCRFPSSRGVEAYWRLLREGAGAIGEVPRARWDVEAYYAPEPATPGKMCTRWGGFIDGIELFDAGLFGIARREADRMDPQQRLLLETSWEALESAGIDPQSLGGSQTCVFVGISTSDYSKLFGLAERDAYSATGLAHSAAVGRISYVLDLWGANEAIDTACSSALVAVHRACAALRSGEASLALAGGVNVLLDPELTVGFSQARMLARDGQCKTFDARADGYVRGEGCGLMVLKRLSDARRDRDLVLSVILGSAVNHDGRSQGLTAPNGLSQQAVIRAAQAAAGVGPTDLSYVEAHGTGTSLGDPQELAALGAVLDEVHKAGRRLPVGSAKTNIGHLEAASGVAGLMKVVLSLAHHEIPMHRNVQSLNSYITMEDLPLLVPTENRPWRVDGRRRACVSSFGFSGTNAHVVLEEAPAESLQPRPTGDRSWHVLTMSARTPDGLRALAGRYAQHLAEHPSETIGDICYAANVGRAAMAHRASLVMQSREEGREALRRWSRGETVEGIAAGEVDTNSGRPRVGFVFPADRGELWGRAGRELYEEYTAFRRAMEQCEKEANGFGESILRFAYPKSGQEVKLEGLKRALAGFALEYSLAELWSSFGVQPAAVAAEGIGRYVAGVVTGIFGLGDGLRLLAARARGPEELRREAGRIRFETSRVRFARREGDLSKGEAAYWGEEGSAAQCPREWERELRADECGLFLGMGTGGERSEEGCGSWLWSLRDGEPDGKQLLRTVSQLHVLGVLLDWRESEEDLVRRKVGLPTYAFEQQRYWLEASRRQRSPSEELDEVHPLLGRKTDSALGGLQFEVVLEGSKAEYLQAHRVQGRPVLPGVAYLELALAGAREAFGDEECALEQVSLERALALGGTRRVQLALVEGEEGRRRFEIHSRGENEPSWTLHARGVLGHDRPAMAVGGEKLSEVRERVGLAVEVGEIYASVGAGIEYGEQFQTVRELWRGEGAEALGRVSLSSAEEDKDYALHPALLDGCLQVACGVQGWPAEAVYLPVGMEKARVWGKVGREAWSHVRVRRGEPTVRVLDVRVWDAEGELRAELEGLQLQRVDSSALKLGPPDKVAWLYEMAWEAKEDGDRQARSADWLPSCGELAKVVEATGDELSRELEAAHEVAHMDPGLDGLCAGYVGRALTSLGLGSEVGKRYELQELAERLGIAPRHRRLFPRLVKMLGETGVLESVGTGWVVRGWREGEDLRAQRESLQRRYPQNASVLTLAGRCGEELASVLRGSSDPLTVLFGDEEAVAGLYRDSPPARYCNKVIREAVRGAAKRLGAGRRVRVLEIGAGTGGTSAHVLPALPAGQTDYVFTDVSSIFLSKAAESFALYGWIEYKVLDIEAEPVGQGFEAQGFDIVIAANVLHATRDLQQTLGHVQKLLAHQGLLVLVEVTKATRFTDITFGLTDGWWHYTDEHLRAGSPLLDVPRWSELLSKQGFSEVVSLPRDKHGEDLGQAVILARSEAAVNAEATESRTQATRSEAVKGRWLLLADRGGKAERLASEMSSRGAVCELAYCAGESPKDETEGGPRRFVDPTKPDEMVRLIGQMARGSGESLRGVVHLWSLDARPIEALLPEALEAELSMICGSVLHLAQALVKQSLSEYPQVVLVTSGVQDPGGADEAWTSESALPAALWGMGRTIANEHPELRCKRVDWLAGEDAKSLAILVEELGRADREDEVALRAGGRYVARLRQMRRAVDEQLRGVELRQDASYLITGGLGGLGQAVARWLVEHGAGHIVLVSRRAPSAAVLKELSAFDPEGVRVTVKSADVSRGDEVQQLLASISEGLPPLRGVIHAAGVVDDASMLHLSWERFLGVLRPKVHGACHLQRLLSNLPLDFFVSFSSFAAIAGSHGQASHAAANGILDGLAHYRRRRGLAGLSIDWGAWSETGYAVRQADLRALGALGAEPISTSMGLEAFATAMTSGAPQVIASPMNWSRFASAMGSRTPVRFEPWVRAATPAKRPVRRGLRRLLEGGNPEERKTILLGYLREQAARVLGADAAQAIPEQKPLRDLGLDSLMAVEMRNRLGKEFEATLPATLVFDYPTLEALSEYLLKEVLKLEKSQPKRVEVVRSVGRLDDIAVVGMSCRFPRAPGVDAYWRLLQLGSEGVAEVPRDRWDIDAYYDPTPATAGKMCTRRGGFVDHIDRFDADLFGITVREAERMDPQQRMLLEVAWEGLENCGIPPKSIGGSQTSVFVGISSWDYAQLLGPQQADAYTATGLAHSVAAGRLSYVLNLCGPNEAVDTACSSSLVAVHRACASLRNGEADLALAGGVNAMLDPAVTVSFCQARMLAPDGRCKTFDVLADGFVRGEGCGLIVLKRLSDARRDGNRILAVIRGTAENHDGRSQGLTAPNGVAQQAVIRRAHEVARLDPSEVGYFETHGTGTALGDPQEVAALGAVVRSSALSTGWRVPVGSVKTNIGHLEAAAGIAGLLKAILALQHEEVPPHRNLSELNPYIDLETLPLSVPTEPRPWRSRPRASVSSFGISGTNAHVVLEAAPPPRAAAAETREPAYDLLTLSAQSHDSLQALARKYATHLAEHPGQAFSDICFTSRTARTHLPHRLVLVVSSAHEARQALRRHLGGESVVQLREGTAPSSQPAVGILLGGTTIRGDEASGRDLYNEVAAFKRELQCCGKLVLELAGVDLPEVLYGAERRRLEDRRVRDLAEFALAWSWLAMLREWAGEPCAVAGLAAARWVAACASGALRLEDGLRLTAGERFVPECGKPAFAVIFGAKSRWAKDEVVSAKIYQAAADAQDASSVVSAMQEEGVRVVVALGGGDARASASQNASCSCVSVPMDSTDSLRGALMVAAELHRRGVDLDWATVGAAGPRSRVELPTYSFAERAFWIGSRQRAIGEWLYEPSWRLQALPARAGNDLPAGGRWLLLADDTGVAVRLVQLLEEQGQHCVLVSAGAPPSPSTLDWRSADWRSPAALQALVAEYHLADPSRPLAGVVHLWGLMGNPAADVQSFGAALELHCRSLLCLVQALGGLPSCRAPRLWLVTRDAQPVAASMSTASLSQSAAIALARVVARELPDSRATRVDISARAGVEDSARAIIEELQNGADPEVARRPEGRWLPSLVSVPTEPARSSPRVRPDASYLITGGLGAVGWEVARWLVDNGAGRVMLASRRGIEAASQRQRDRLSRWGERVDVVQCDVSSVVDLERVLSSDRELPLRGIVHAAGVLDDALLADQDWPHFERALAPKAVGALALHALTREQELDFFVTFSSAAAAFGSPGQANYVAANAVLDSLAHWRRQMNLCAQSIEWGPWQVGMTERLGSTHKQQWERLGIGSLTTPEAIATLEHAMACPAALLVALKVRRSGVLANLSFAEPQASDSRAVERGAVRVALAALPQGERQGRLLEHLAARLGEVAGVSRFDDTADMFASGVDSLMVIQLLQKLEADLDLRLFPREVMKHPRLQDLARYLCSELAGGPITSDATPRTAPTPQTPPARRVPVRSLAKRNRRAAFVLSAPRSGSTLLRVMLAGHPKLFSPPELHLLAYDGMAAWQSALKESYLTEGLVRALMELASCDAETAKREVADLVARDAPTVEVYRQLQQRLGARLLVDKSPTYAVNVDTLRKVEAWFEGAKCIHLVRHPYPVIESFVRNRMDKLIDAGDGDSYARAEEIWTRSNENLLFLERETEPQRFLRVRYEDLVAAPERVMRGICEFLEVPFDPRVLQPYEGERMTGGVFSRSQQIGDPNFLRHKSIEGELGEAWRRIALPHALGPVARKVAKSLDYVFTDPEPNAETNGTSETVAVAARAVDLEVRGLRLHLWTWGHQAGSAVLCLHGGMDDGASWESVAQPLARRGFYVVAPDQRGHGASDHVGKGGRYDVADFVLDAAELISRVAECPLVLVGHSLGGLVAALVASLKPQYVQKLVLVEPVAPDALASSIDTYLEAAGEARGHTILRSREDAIERLRARTPSLALDMATRMVDRLTTETDGGLVWRFDPAIRQIAALGFTSQSVVGTLRRCTAPALVVCGTRGDRSNCAFYADAMAQASFVDVTAGHNVHLEAPLALADLIGKGG